MTDDKPTMKPDVLAERPFYFMMNVWGDDYRWMFLNLNLASLLSPNNIPALANKASSRFLILAPRREIELLEREPMIRLLREHVVTEMIEIPDPETAGDKFELNTFSYKLGADRCFADKAYGLFLCPDTLLSDGTIMRLQERARAGAKVVQVAALRHDQEGVIEALKSMKSITLGQPLTFEPRALMKFGLQHLHPQVHAHDWDGGAFSTHPGFCLWRVPGSDGLILHTMRWNPLLISYADMPKHVTWSRFGGENHIGMDDDYIFNNFGDDSAVHYVADTDEIAYVSLTPQRLSVGQETAASDFSKRVCLRVSAQDGMMDPLQWRLFRVHIRVHGGPLDHSWHERERQIDRILDRCLARTPTAFDRFWQRYLARGWRRLAGRALARLAGLLRVDGLASQARRHGRAS